jgi:hypothetical protein
MLRPSSSGDHFGEFVLLGTREYSVAAIALQDTLLLCLDRQTFNQLLDENPDIRKFLLASIASRRLVHARRFTWLSKGEHIYLILRKHWTYLLVTLVLPTWQPGFGLAMFFFSFGIEPIPSGCWWNGVGFYFFIGAVCGRFGFGSIGQMITTLSPTSAPSGWKGSSVCMRIARKLPFLLCLPWACIAHSWAGY